jgi:hypothetical protein
VGKGVSILPKDIGIDLREQKIEILLTPNVHKVIYEDDQGRAAVVEGTTQEIKACLIEAGFKVFDS